MDFEENENGDNHSDLVIRLSLDMMNRKYKIRPNEQESKISKNQIYSKDIRFYNKRLLHIFKSLLLKKQCMKNTDEVDLAITNIPDEIIDMGNDFITQCILFFKMEDRNELIQQELIDVIETGPILNERYENEIFDYNKELYRPTVSKNTGVFEIEEENNNDNLDCKSIPLKREYNLRDNRFRLKGVSKNNNMSILYEQDETEK